MTSAPAARSRVIPLFLALVAFACAPIWTVAAFVPQDGPAHAYSASMMLELLRGEESAVRPVAWNAWTTPNSSGHWLLALLLGFASPLVATKVLATLTFAGVVAAVGFLRFASVGREGLGTSLLLGAAIAFNWLWLCGLYNFLIGVSCLAVTLGCYCRWRERPRAMHVAGLALLVLVVYFSHPVACGVLAASLLTLALGEAADRRRRACTLVLLALLPAVLVAVLHALLPGAVPGAVPASESLFPVWRRLDDAGSIASWIFQIRTADPFVLISRRAFPFVSAPASAFVLFTPLLWLLAALAGLAGGALSRRARSEAPGRLRPQHAWRVLFVVCALLAMFGPDDFGPSRGTLLRERLALLAVILFVPLFRLGSRERGPGGGGARPTARLAQVLLVGVVLFQTAALWEYARSSSRDAVEFLALRPALLGQRSLAAVVVLEDGKRFHSNPEAQMSNFFGIGRRTVVWDNYEIGYDLFPLVARDPADARFAREFTSLNVFAAGEPPAEAEARLERLDACFAADARRVGTLLLWNRDPRVEAVLANWFEAEPFFEQGRGRLYRRRAGGERAQPPQAYDPEPENGNETDP